MTPRTIIGITMDAQDNPPAGGRSPTGNSGAYHLAFDYCDAIEKAGGLPLAIPYRTHQALIPQYVDLCDGILFTGGNDLDPALYGEGWHPKAVKVDPDRQNFEMALLAEVEKRRTPALFICMGCQVLNVHRGGSLTQFIGDDATKMEHRKGDGDVRRHDVTVDPNSTLGKAVGRQAFSTNTYHKQAVKTVGKGLKVVATAPDGTVEAIEGAGFVIGVQWHAETMAEHLPLFEALVAAASSQPLRAAA
jgi:putative glutamine amidotransferase